MRTKLYVLGAVLGVVPGLPPEGEAQPVGPPTRETKRDTPPVKPAEPKHPCQLVTFIQVPCDESTATCEYTYWECPKAVKPLRA